MKMNKFKNLIILLLLGITLTGTIIPVKASVVSFKKEVDGITLTLDKGFMNVKICKDNIVEVKFTILPAFPAKTSLIITNEWKTTPKFTVTETGDEITLSTEKLIIAVNKHNNSISYFDSKKGLILAEDPANGKSMTQATVAGIQTDRKSVV